MDRWFTPSNTETIYKISSGFLDYLFNGHLNPRITGYYVGVLTIRTIEIAATGENDRDRYSWDIYQTDVDY
jgi:hypothetical protein